MQQPVASGVRSDKSVTASFPQSLTPPPKPESPHYKSGCAPAGPPQGAREGLKAPNSTSSVVLAAGHQVAGGCGLKERHRETIFSFLKKGKATHNETAV